MARVLFFVIAGLFLFKPAQAADLNKFSQTVLDGGFLDRFPNPIGELVGVQNDRPYYGVRISSDQANDNMNHGFMLLLDSGNKRSDEFVMFALRVQGQDSETIWFRVSFKDKLQKVIVITGKKDSQGQAIKGSGKVIEGDIKSPEMKKRFQHEMDLWLKKSYLRKEWRSAEFSQGQLKKK